jgi:acyl-coenzyme A synthetase/AMP-(fatty) acid ligase
MTTADRIAFHATERPEAAALVNGGRTISYAEFRRDIGKFVVALREFGLPHGSTVAIGCDDVYTHWLLLLAFERLNVATASFDRMETPPRELIAGVDLVLSEAHFLVLGATRHRAITEAWVRDTFALDHEDGRSGVQEAPGDLIRILRSSGTTGREKRLAVTRHMYELRVVRYAERYQFTRKSRYLLTLPFSVGHVYGNATACLRSGGTVVTVDTAAGDAPRVFAKYGITHVSLQPLMLKQLLDNLPPNLAKPGDLTIGTFGSALSDELSGRALKKLATEVADFFGCNEIGGISCRRATLCDAFATVCPGVEVEAIDENDRPVPCGEPGQLRIRSESMVGGYIDDAEATRRFFKDGWFYTSDVAILDGPLRLKVIGRSDELLNIAGGKHAPSDLEAHVMKHAGVGDVGICALANREGIQEIHVAVANVRHDQGELLARITRAFSGVPLGNFHVVILEAIPRNAAGKIQRAVLKEAVAAAHGSHGVERRPC